MLWSDMVCLGLLYSALEAAGLAAGGLAAADLAPLQCRMGRKGRKGLLTSPFAPCLFIFLFVN